MKTTLKTRLMLVMGIMSTLMLLLGLTGLYAMKASHDSLKSSHEERSLGLYKLANMDKLLLANRHAILAALAEPDAGKLRTGADTIEHDSRTIEQLWLDVATLPMSTDARKKADELSAARLSFEHAVTLPAIKAMQAADMASLRQINQAADKLNGPVISAMDSLRTLQLDALNKEYGSAEADYARISNLMWAAIVLGLALSAALAYFLIHVIYQQLGGEPAYAAQIARQMADGDYAVSITPDVHDDASLLASLQQLQRGLEKIGKDMHLHTGSIVRTSVQIQSSNAQLSSRMDQQSASHTQISLAARDLSTAIRQNSEQARQAMQLADEASELAIKKAQAGSGAMAAMTELRHAWDKLDTNIQVIDELVFQLDTAVLRSTVEGKAVEVAERVEGSDLHFATVASEVRGLAQGAACAVHEIKNLLNESWESLDRAGRLTSQNNADAEKLLFALQHANKLMAGIDGAGKKQEANLRQIRHAVSDLDYASRKDAILLGTAMTAAKLMEQHASHLTHLSNGFKPGAGHKAKSQLQVVSAVVTEHVSHKRPDLRIVRT
ncbi:Tar ligand binding domain-containing protein [Undibacterium sp. TC4M20W]|uniref:Tar ligand binding domain-containing protein n=1 Tax=Undibacterium sp. TC4M20W TaxID=3413052 RepID=UPI003BF2655B